MENVKKVNPIMETIYYWVSLSKQNNILNNNSFGYWPKSRTQAKENIRKNMNEADEKENKERREEKKACERERERWIRKKKED